MTSGDCDRAPFHQGRSDYIGVNLGNMADIEDIMKVGRELGLEGTELREFVGSERNYYAKVEAEAREERKIQREWEQRKYELEREKQERETELIAKQMELLKLQEHSGEGGREHNPLTPSSVKVKGPNMPPFDAAKDELDSYLCRFERFASAAGWDRANCAIILSSRLQGTALDFYSLPSSDEPGDYDKVKRALTGRFGYAEDGYRTRFWTTRPQKVRQIASLLPDCKHCWIVRLRYQRKKKL